MAAKPDKSMQTERGRAAVWMLGALVVFCSIVWALPRPTLGLLPKPLVVQQTPLASDAIVVLLGSDGPDRILKAYELYRQGLAPRIVFGSGFEDRQTLRSAPPGFVWLPSSSKFEAALISLKVPKSDYIIVDTAQDFDSANELKRISAFVRKEHWRSVILVSSAAHTRRVHMIWGRIAPDIRHYTMPAASPELEEWWKSRRRVHQVVYEYAGLAKEAAAQIKHLIGLEE